MFVQIVCFLSLWYACVGDCPAQDTRKPCSSCARAKNYFDGFCVQQCPKSYITTKQNGYPQCKLCDLTKFLIPNKQRTGCECAVQHFIPPLSAECVPCHYTCLTCTGPQENHCEKCESKSVETFRKKTNEGTCACQKGYTDDPEFPSLKCSPCHSDCVTCSGPSDEDCIRCAKGRIKDQSTGFCVCSSDFIEDQSGDCVCPPPFIVHHQKCVESLNNLCQPGQAKVKKNPKDEEGMNLNSDSLNTQLSQGSELICQCKPGLYLIKGVCQECGENEVYNQKNKKCVCSDDAIKYKKQCIICEENKKFSQRDGMCKCKKNFHETKTGQCIKCSKKEILIDGVCQCAFNFYRNEQGKCQRCQEKTNHPSCEEVTTIFDRPVVLALDH